jgi:hypothetical protein
MGKLPSRIGLEWDVATAHCSMTGWELQKCTSSPSPLLLAVAPNACLEAEGGEQGPFVTSSIQPQEGWRRVESEGAHGR